MDIEQLRKPLLYPIVGADDVVLQRNLVYREEGGDQLQMDVYVPPDLAVETRLPGVVFIHGGPIPESLPICPKDWGVFQSYGTLAALSGLIGITFNHRFFSPHDLEQAASDISAAIAYVRHRAGAFHLDPQRLCLWAFSGGGDFLGPFMHARPPFVRCLVSFYALLDLRHLQVAAELGEELVQRFSPAVALQAGGPVPPMLIARAGQDSPLVNDSVDRFIQAAFAAHQTLDLLNHPDGRHGFDTMDDHPRTREIIERTIAFIKAHTTCS
jgi:acetyl esterase/lipase